VYTVSGNFLLEFVSNSVFGRQFGKAIQTAILNLSKTMFSRATLYVLPKLRTGRLIDSKILTIEGQFRRFVR
jgi:hypothetical protein